MKKIAVIASLLFLLALKVAGQDTIYTVKLPQVTVENTRNWKNDTARYRYNQLRYYVKSVLPYVNAASALFNEINAKLEQPGLSRAERKKYISSKEDAIREQFENKVRNLNVTQGKLLMKLIARQTGANVYELLSDFKSPVTAMKWQAWAQLNGININKKYHPEDEHDLEQIMESLDYPLPEFYGQGTASR